MDLRTTIDLIRRSQKELALFNVTSSDALGERLGEYFATQNVRITTYETASGRPADIAVLSRPETVLEIMDVDLLRGFVDYTPSEGGFGITDVEYEPVLTHLKETTFTSYDTTDMLYASREIEDRARRVGDGTIHAGFQRCSLMADQASIYTNLAARGVEVHAYGIPDVTPPGLGRGQVHTPETDEIAEMWFVVFDGGGSESQKCALLAEQRGEESFYGAWTYDPAVVDGVLGHLEETYVDADSSTPSFASDRRNDH